MKYVIKITQKLTKQFKNHELNKKIKSTRMKKKLVDFILYSRDVIHRNNLTHDKELNQVYQK